MEKEGPQYQSKSMNSYSIPYDQIQALLKQASLPYQDIQQDHIHFVTKVEENKLIGCAAIEIQEEYGLLRSVVVHADYRSKGVAQELITELLNYSKNQKLHSLYLLTETAEDYFKQLGFQKIDRLKAPRPIQRTSEFAELCPSSATCMILVL